MTKTIFKTKAVSPGTTNDYGKYGSYMKGEDGKWRRQKKGYPSFRKTLNHKKMSEFLLAKGITKSFLEKHGVKTLRSMIKSKDLTREYRLWGEENG